MIHVLAITAKVGEEKFQSPVNICYRSGVKISVKI